VFVEIKNYLQNKPTPPRRTDIPLSSGEGAGGEVISQGYEETSPIAQTIPSPQGEGLGGEVIEEFGGEVIIRQHWRAL